MIRLQHEPGLIVFPEWFHIFHGQDHNSACVVYYILSHVLLDNAHSQLIQKCIQL